jgi:hydroxyacylglutathione hydrolase
MTNAVEVDCLAVGMLGGNCYLVKCGQRGEGVIIDPGGEPERIAEHVERFSLLPEVILLTHGHIDHTNAAGALRKRFRSRVVCHKDDSEMVRGGEGFALWGLERTPCDVDQEVVGEEALDVGEKSIKIVHTPGHTQGSVCYMIDNCFFSGDTLFRGSIGRMDLPGGSEKEMRESLSRIEKMLGGGTVIYPGHGPVTDIEHERRFNPFL